MKNKQLLLLFEILLDPNSLVSDYTNEELIEIGLSHDDLNFRGNVPYFTKKVREKCINILLNHFSDIENRLNNLETK